MELIRWDIMFLDKRLDGISGDPQALSTWPGIIGNKLAPFQKFVESAPASGYHLRGFFNAIKKLNQSSHPF